MVFTLKVKPDWHKIRWFVLFFVLFFTVSTIGQYAYIRHRLKNSIDNLLDNWGNQFIEQVKEEINSKGIWNIKLYDRNYYDASAWDIITDNWFMDIEDGMTDGGLIKTVILPPEIDESIFIKPKTINPEVNQSWRVLGKRLKDGVVILTITNPADEAFVDNKLIKTSNNFNNKTISEAISVPVNKTNKEVNYAILDNSYNLKMGVGDLPFKTSQNFSDDLTKKYSFKTIGGDEYLILYHKIFNKNQDVLIMPYNFKYQNQALKNLLEFNIILAIISAIILFLHSLYNWSKQEAQKEMVKQAFQSYLSPQVMDIILKDFNPSNLALGGQRKEITVLFSDIRSFTAISEKLSPGELTDLLHEYFTEMTEEVFNSGGVLDKFIGDAIMAFWGAPIDQPNQADMAVITAINMIKRLKKLRIGWAEKGYPLIDIGIGINSGFAIVGNMGSEKRFDYTVIGDDVNIASRLESLNKKYKSNIIISEAVKDKLTIPVKTEALGKTVLRGKTTPIKIYKIKT